MANEISNANTGSVTDSDGNPVENAQIIAVRQEDTANLSQSQATEITALAKLTDANGDFTITENELYGDTNQYHIVANVENNEQRGTPNYPHVDATGNAIPDSEVSRTPDNNTSSLKKYLGLRITVAEEWPDRFDGEISANTADATRARIIRESDSTTIGSSDISYLSSGDFFSVDLSTSLKTDDSYKFVLDAEGLSWTVGNHDSDDEAPFTSSDGIITIEKGVKEGGSSSTLNAIVTVGNLI